MNHPSVVTLERGARPRVVFSGDRLVPIDLPAGTRVLYSKPPIAPLKNVDAAIRYAINHPIGSDPLYARLHPGMKVTIAMDNMALPLPPMKRPDARERILTVVLELLANHGIDDVEIIVASSVHRRATESEIRHMVGDKIFDAYYPDRLYNHDAEDPANMVEVGKTELGEVVELNRRAVESDLVIYANINFVPMNGGHKSVAVGLCGYKSLRYHHNPKTMRECHSYMDPKNSALASGIERLGRVANQHLKVFTIETTLNNKMFDSPLEFLAKNEDDLDDREWTMLKALVATTARLPQPARQAIFSRVPAPYGVIGVNAGETEAVHEKTIDRCFEQYLVPIEGQADVLVTGIPYISPYNVHAFLNPLLVQVLAQGYLFNMYRGAPLVKKGGTLILTHPCTDKFDHEQHAPYVDFVHRLLPETRDAMELHKRYEEKFAKNPAFIQMYRDGHAYHPSHPFFMWYWGEAGRQHLGRVIVVGADNEYIPKLMGWETAPNMDEALYRARGGEAKSQEITLLHAPPIVMGDVTVRAPRSGGGGAA
ncbi:MAG TPA: lactate racemase domain-containing protein [Polyangiaceae bacterium]|nr:lactate racemase domain-containing protein [Polyangiaceae bacterium]